VLTAVTSVSEVIVIFLQPIIFANTAAFFCFLLEMVTHTDPEGGDRPLKTYENHFIHHNFVQFG